MRKSLVAIICILSLVGVRAEESLSLHAGATTAPICNAKLTRTSAGVDVWVCPNQPWSGVSFRLQNDIDLTRWYELVVTVSNTMDTVLALNVHVKTVGFYNDSLQGWNTIPAHGVGEIVVSPIRKSHTIKTAIPGLRGYEQASGESGLNLEKIGIVDVFRSPDAKPATFRVLSIRTRGPGRGKQTRLVEGEDFFPFVDEFGQFKHGEWPGKVHSEAELRAANRQEAAEMSSAAESPIPDVDRFGGWMKGPRFKATGYFRVEKVDGIWWYVDPDGYLFFSHGIDCVSAGRITGITKREKYFTWLPNAEEARFRPCFGKATWAAPHGFYSKAENVPYETFDFVAANLIRRDGSAWREQARDLVHRRFRYWGVNTIGNWSDWNTCRLDRTPYVATVHTGSFPKKLPRSKGWWGPLPDVFDAEYPVYVRKQVRSVASWMKKDPWCLGVFVDNELSWNEEQETLKAAERYFTVVSSIVREEMPNHLYMGCRFMSNAGGGMYRAAARYCDVVSVNIYAHTPKVTFPEDAVDRPVQIGEFHFGALDRGMLHTGLVPVADQAERAACYKRYLYSVINDSRMIGAHWFEYRDQPLTGRFDSECYQIGFVNVADVPYPEMVEAAREIGRTMYERRRAGK